MPIITFPLGRVWEGLPITLTELSTPFAPSGCMLGTMRKLPRVRKHPYPYWEAQLSCVGKPEPLIGCKAEGIYNRPWHVIRQGQCQKMLKVMEVMSWFTTLSVLDTCSIVSASTILFGLKMLHACIAVLSRKPASNTSMLGEPACGAGSWLPRNQGCSPNWENQRSPAASKAHPEMSSRCHNSLSACTQTGIWLVGKTSPWHCRGFVAQPGRPFLGT